MCSLRLDVRGTRARRHSRRLQKGNCAGCSCSPLLTALLYSCLPFCLPPTRHLTSYLAVAFPVKVSALWHLHRFLPRGTSYQRGDSTCRSTPSRLVASVEQRSICTVTAFTLLVGEVHKHRAGRCLQHTPAFTLPAPDFFFFFFFFGRRSRYLPFRSIPP